jgi:hypothetical protein
VVQCAITFTPPPLTWVVTTEALPPPTELPYPGRATIPPRSALLFRGTPPPGAAFTLTVWVENRSAEPATVAYDAPVLTITLTPGLAVVVQPPTLPADVVPRLTPAEVPRFLGCDRVAGQPHVISCRRVNPHPPGFVAFDAVPVAELAEATLNLDEPRPCIPQPGQDHCDDTRWALWHGRAEAWTARGVTDPEARFTATVLLRVQAGDPATISALARLLGSPYLKITRVRFVLDEFVEVTNLGGGTQEMMGWSLRSAARNGSFPFPPVVLQPGDRCTLYTGPPRTEPVGVCQWFTGTRSNPPGGWWPDDAGDVLLAYDALDLVADATVYDADPNRQPSPPNFQLAVPGPAPRP